MATATLKPRRTAKSAQLNLETAPELKSAEAPHLLNYPPKEKTTYEYHGVQKVSERRSSSGVRFITVRIPVSKLPLVPYETNVRELKRSSDPYRNMLKQLSTADDGRLFEECNNGIRCAATEFRQVGNTIFVTNADAFQGNHTQHAIAEAMAKRAEYPGADTAYVEVEFVVGADITLITKLAIASNNQQNQKQIDMYAAQGTFNDLKAVLNEETRKLMEERSGDGGDFGYHSLVRLLALVSNKSFPIQNGQHPLMAYNSREKLLKRFAAGEFKENLGLLNDLVKLDLLVRKKIIEMSGRTTGKSRTKGAIGLVMKALDMDADRPQQTLAGELLSKTVGDWLVYLVIHNFRAYIRDGAFVFPIEELFEGYGTKTIEAVYAKYRTSGKKTVNEVMKTADCWLPAVQYNLDQARDLGVRFTY